MSNKYSYALFYRTDRDVKYIMSCGINTVTKDSEYYKDCKVTSYMEEFNSDLILGFAEYNYLGTNHSSNFRKEHKLSEYENIRHVISMPYYVQDFSNPVYSKSEDLIYFYENVDKLSRGISTKIKVGRFFKKLYPFLNDKQVEEFVKLFREEFAVHDTEVVIGEKPEDFKFAYLESNYFNISRDTSEFKSLRNSCMRYEFYGQKHHPSEMYGSGDFEIHYLKGQGNKVFARAVVHKESKTYAGIYALQDAYGKTLKKHLEENGHIYFDEDHDRNWFGAKLLKNYENSGGISVAYMDGFSDVYDDGDYLVIERSGEFSLQLTGGVLFLDKKCECHECGSYIDEDDTYSVNWETYCEDCVTYCEYSNEYVAGETFLVYYSRYTQYIWSVDYIGEAIYLKDLGIYIAPDSDYYEHGELDGEYYSGEWFINNGYEYEDGEWVKIEDEEEEEEN